MTTGYSLYVKSLNPEKDDQKFQLIANSDEEARTEAGKIIKERGINSADCIIKFFRDSDNHHGTILL